MNGFQFFYSTNDDYGISQLLSIGDDKSLFLNYFFSDFLVKLYNFIPNLNWFVIIQVILNYLSLVCINYVFIKKFDLLLSTILIIGYSLLFINQFITIIQWTQTATILITSGFLLLCYTFIWNKESSNKLLNTLLSNLLILFGTSIRFSSLLPCALLFGVYVFSYWLVIILKDRIDKKSILKASRKAISIFLSMILVILLTISNNYISNAIKNNDKQFYKYSSYNIQRSNSVDYYNAPYLENKSFYNNIGIKSENDLKVLHNFTTDIGFFNISRIKSINEYSNAVGYGKNFFIKNLSDKVSLIFKRYGIHIITILIILFVMIVLLIKYKEKYPFVFPMLLLFVFLSYFWLFKFDYVYIMALPIMVLVLITGFSFNRYHFIPLSLLTVLCLAMIFVLNFIRLNFRVAFNIFFPTIVLLMCLIDKNNIRSKYMIYNYKKPILICSVGIMLFVNIVSAVIICDKEEYRRKNDNQDIANYISENSDTLFVSEGVDISVNYDTPFISPDFNNNFLQNGWSVGSSTFYNQLDDYKIENLFEDCVNNPKINFVLEKKQFAQYAKYFNSHYTHNVSLIIDKDFGEICTVLVCEK